MTHVNLQMFPCIFLLMVSCLATGCDKSVHVTGTVTYSDDGSPVKFGQVVFMGESEVVRGTINNGAYSLGRFEDGDGVLPGSYRVSADSLEIPHDPTAVNFDGSKVEPPPPKELYYTKEPQTIVVEKTMIYDFTVERGKRR